MSRYERPNISAMQGYSYGEQPEDSRIVKLNTNENPYPPSPAVQQALSSLDVAQLRTYPQATADPLRDELARLHNLQRQNVVVTNGGDEALRLALTTFVEPGSSFGMAEPSYSLYPVLAEIQNATVTRVALNERWEYPDDFCQQLNQANVQLTCVVNPHAPSGHLVAVDVLAAMARQLSGLLLIDEAYADFISPDCGYDSSHLLREYNNVLILRTFSKGYALAGLRLGYLLGAGELIAPIINKTRDSYNIDQVSQALGKAALTDQAYARKVWQRVREDRQMLQNKLAQLGLFSPPSESNFLLVTVPATSPANAEAVYQALQQAGILVRYFNMPGLQDKLRISVGTQAENQRLLQTLTTILSANAS